MGKTGSIRSVPTQTSTFPANMFNSKEAAKPMAAGHSNHGYESCQIPLLGSDRHPSRVPGEKR